MSLSMLSFLKLKRRGMWALIWVERRQEQIVFNIRQECYLGLSAQPEVLWHFFLTHLKLLFFFFSPAAAVTGIKSTEEAHNPSSEYINEQYPQRPNNTALTEKE